jgi:HK97 family phage prohead protease
MTLERRATSSPPELRANDSGKVAAGYAALFNTKTDIGGYFTETILPGAFDETIRTSDVRALIDHDTGRVIGRSSAKTLRLKEDDKGLSVEIDLPDTSDGRDLAVQLDRGDISGMSFGFKVTHDEWDETGAIPARTIHKVDLYEVSAVAFPAYDDATIALRSVESAMKSLDEARKELKRKNFNAAGQRLRMKTNLELKLRSKA